MATPIIHGAKSFNAAGSFAGLDFLPDGESLVALVPGDGRTRLLRFRVQDGRLLDERTVADAWTGMAIFPDGDCLLWTREAIARLDAGDQFLWRIEAESGMAFRLVTVAQDGSLLAAYGSKSIAQLFDGRTGKRLHTVREPAGEIFAFAFSSDGSLFATGGEKGVVRLFDRETKNELAQRKSTKVLALAFSPDGQVLAGGHGQGDVRLWQIPSLKPVSSFRGASHRFFKDYGRGEEDLGPAGCRWLSFSPDGQGLLSQGNDNALRSWELDGSLQRRVTIPHRHPQDPAMALSRDGRWIAAGSTPAALSVWSSSGEPVSDERSFTSAHAIALTPSEVVLASDWAYSSWHRKDGTAKERARNGFPSAVVALRTGDVLVFDVNTVSLSSDVTKPGKELFKLDGSPRPGTMRLSRDGKVVAFPVDTSVELWDWERGVRVGEIPHEVKVHACAFGHDDTWIVSVSDTIQMWRLDDSEQPVWTVRLKKDPAICGGVAVSPVGWIAVSIDHDISNHYTDSALVFIDPRSGTVTATLRHPGARLGQVAFVDATRAVVVDSSGRLLMADAEKGCWLDRPEPSAEDVNLPDLEIFPLAVSEDGSEVAHVDAWQNIRVVRVEPQGARSDRPLDIGTKKKTAAESKPAGMFEQRLAGAKFLFVGNFNSSEYALRTKREFREETVRELGGTVAKTPKGITHFVAARKPYTKHSPTAAEIEVDERIARGEKIIKLSEKKMIELLLPTFEEARAMLGGEIEEGIERWNRWRSRYRTLDGGFMHLPGIDLAGIDLRKANLMVMHFEEANLSGACLAGVDLYDCVFRGANLRGANLDGARCGRVNFTGADLREAKLGADLGGAVFDGADLRGADLRNAQLQYAKLEGAKLDGAKLPGSFRKE
ncbi:pentapeptide repeat-containing protein [Polyangium aurulentum]|uniref:pentapeptide repeat-containing protein n=1 Tax=Polyangium aurulentum TaxID=2567896 RepID=UPI00200BAD5A|nr:pentapeptide repeat-containing protein [Polyangium aurulentum]UQA60497.1 pentapeptide repeat-containing protein [Polyangium aurulentum]